MVYTCGMDKNTHRSILAQMYGCKETELIARFDRMMPQIRNDAIVTLCIERKTDKQIEVMA